MDILLCFFTCRVVVILWPKSSPYKEVWCFKLPVRIIIIPLAVVFRRKIYFRAVGLCVLVPIGDVVGCRRAPPPIANGEIRLNKYTSIHQIYKYIIYIEHRHSRIVSCYSSIINRALIMLHLNHD